MTQVDLRANWRGPYRRKNARPLDERLADRMCPQPPCKCGCGEGAIWRASRGRWGAYAQGHYRKDAPYKHREWLLDRYVERGQTTHEMAQECGVGHGAILKSMRKLGVERRDRSESRVGRMVGAKNPAWKGGVADWPYAEGWKTIARKIRDRDKWTCQACGEQRKRWGHSLHVHHIDEDKLNNDPSNLISLCALCHRQAHRREVI